MNWPCVDEIGVLQSQQVEYSRTMMKTFAKSRTDNALDEENILNIPYHNEKLKENTSSLLKDLINVSCYIGVHVCCLL